MLPDAAGLAPVKIVRMRSGVQLMVPLLTNAEIIIRTPPRGVKGFSPKLHPNLVSCRTRYHRSHGSTNTYCSPSYNHHLNLIWVEFALPQLPAVLPQT